MLSLLNNIRKSGIKLHHKFFISLTLILIFSFIYNMLDDHHFRGLAEIDRKDGDKFEYTILHSEEFTRYLNRLYLSIIVQSTVGFGDIFPDSNTMRLIMGTQAFTTICLAYA